MLSDLLLFILMYYNLIPHKQRKHGKTFRNFYIQSHETGNHKYQPNKRVFCFNEK